MLKRKHIKSVETRLLLSKELKG